MASISSLPRRWAHRILSAPGWYLGVAVLLLCSVSWAQIDVPAESAPYKLVVARLTTPIPEGAYLADGGWEVVGASASVQADVREYGGEIVWTGPPGVYSVLFDGVLLKDITFKDGDGNQVTIKSYLGRIKAKAMCTIKGSTPGPDPPAPGNRRGVILEESKERTALQALLYDQIQLKLKGKVQVWDDDQPGAQQYARLTSNTSRPLLLVLSDTGQLVRAVPVPSSVVSVEEELAK